MDVLYTDDAGKVFVRHGGSRAWRNNNPGNIRKSSPEGVTKLGDLKDVQLDAVLVAGRSGFYLRARPDEVQLNNLDVMAAEAA